LQKRIRQLLDQIEKVNPIPRNYNILKGLIDAYLNGYNWETMTQSENKEWTNGWSVIVMPKFWKLRGR